MPARARPSPPSRDRAVEWGDFQTPPELARAVAEHLSRSSTRPRAIVEPTCGRGEVLAAVLARETDVALALGVEWSRAHLDVARGRGLGGGRTPVVLEHADAFALDWAARLRELPSPVWLVGNPPWVTRAAIGRVDGTNGPPRRNVDGTSGILACTGGANFDLSEALLRTLLDAARGLDARLAFLCKASVARKVLAHAWRSRAPLVDARVHAIDAPRWFGAAVEAVLLDVTLTAELAVPALDSCAVLPDLELTAGTSWGWRDGRVVGDAEAYDRGVALRGRSPIPWRSGVKHDVARVLELTETTDGLVNGHGEHVDVEDEVVFPLWKSGDVARPSARTRRRLLVPQRSVGESTVDLARRAPRAAAYLERHAPAFARRKSSIYRGRDRFALFGVGPYTFAPWKVAISALHKRLDFVVVPPEPSSADEATPRPVVFDDACYFLPCATADEAHALGRWLHADAARAFLAAQVFSDAKRVVTAALLNELDLRVLASRVDGEGAFERTFATSVGARTSPA